MQLAELAGGMGESLGKSPGCRASLRARAHSSGANASGACSSHAFAEATVPDNPMTAVSNRPTLEEVGRRYGWAAGRWPAKAPRPPAALAATGRRLPANAWRLAAAGRPKAPRPPGALATTGRRLPASGWRPGAAGRPKAPNRRPLWPPTGRPAAGCPRLPRLAAPDWRRRAAGGPWLAGGQPACPASPPRPARPPGPGLQADGALWELAACARKRFPFVVPVSGPKTMNTP